MIRLYKSLFLKGNVLDLGVGDGRNIIHFANNGYSVEGVDISSKAIELASKSIAKITSRANFHNHNVSDFKITKECYSVIMCNWVLMYLRKNEFEDIIKRIKQGVIKNGIIYLSVLTKKDPIYSNRTKDYDELEDGTLFHKSTGDVLTFYEPLEIMNHFNKNFEIIGQRESFVMHLTHGKPHYHGEFEVMLRKF